MRRWDGQVERFSTCANIRPTSLNAAFGSLLRSAGDHRSLPTAAVVFKTYKADSIFFSSIGSSKSSVRIFCIP
eukprot:5277737-Karenia_brevis.AAC.1